MLNCREEREEVMMAGNRWDHGMGADIEVEKRGADIEVEKRMVVEYGVELDGVWLPLAMLRRLGQHGPWDSPFTEATADQERVLLAHSLADRHNHSGLHRGAGLTGFLDAVPFEPTVPFAAVPGDGPGDGRPGDGGRNNRAPTRDDGPRGTRS